MDEAKVSLYFGVQNGRHADLEIVAKAAIEWAAAVRLAAEMIDPNASVQIQVVDADESSFRLNAALDWIEGQLERISSGADQHPRLKKLAVALAIFILVDAGPAQEYWFGEDVEVELSAEDRALLRALLEKVSESEELRKTTKRFFATIERDPAISSIGVSEGRNQPLAISVPSSDFAARSGLWSLDEHIDERTSERRLDVTLLRAPLENAPRKWRFRHDETGQEFSAKMRDEQFLQALEDGEIDENLRIGITMTIQVSLKERLVKGEWLPVETSWVVLNVLHPAPRYP